MVGRYKLTAKRKKRKRRDAETAGAEGRWVTGF